MSIYVDTEGPCGVRPWINKPLVVTSEQIRRAVDEINLVLRGIPTEDPLDVRRKFFKSLADPDSNAEIDVDITVIEDSDFSKTERL